MTRYPETQDGDTSQQVCCLAGWQLWEMQMSCLRVVMEAEACVGPKGQVCEDLEEVKSIDYVMISKKF